MPTQSFKNILKKAFNDIDPQAIDIIKKLKNNGYDGYLVGGGVRDLLVGLKPKDFDIATNALPNEVKKRVPYCFIIGRRFKLVHAKRGDKIFEVATYRREATVEELQTVSENDLNYVEDNFFGTLKEDSFRRDFTINALFYDPLSENLVDYCGGLSDIESNTLRVIGEPVARLKEDPIRILRAVRLSQKLGFQIEPELRKAISDHVNELQRSVLPRRREEWLKFFRLSKPHLALWEMFDLGIFKAVIPSFDELWQQPDKVEEFLALIQKIPSVDINVHDPIELFSAILYAFLIAHSGYNFNIIEVSENPHFQIFCRDELGIFKAELVSIVFAMQMVQTLSRRDIYLKKGERRRRAVVNNLSFELGLKLGLMSYELTFDDYLFWTQQKEELLQKIELRQKEISNPENLD